MQEEKPPVSDMTITDAQDGTEPDKWFVMTGDHKTVLVHQLSPVNKDTVPVQEEKPLVSDMTTTDAHHLQQHNLLK